jgi:uncharacterized protein
MARSGRAGVAERAGTQGFRGNDQAVSIRDERGLASRPAGDESVADYLADHPDFFERHAGLLERLRLPHRAGAATVSLVERQVSMLQDKNRALERRLRELVEVARSNSALSDKVHTLAIRLLKAGDAMAVLAELERGLREDFGASQALVVLLHNSSEIVTTPSSRFLRTANRADPALKSFATFMQNGRPRCGRIRDVQRDFLFPGDAEAIASVAMVPLGQNCEIGILAIGSSDAQRFNPTMSTDFLARIGELTAAALTAARLRLEGARAQA